MRGLFARDIVRYRLVPVEVDSGVVTIARRATRGRLVGFAFQVREVANQPKSSPFPIWRQDLHQVLHVHSDLVPLACKNTPSHA